MFVSNPYCTSHLAYNNLSDSTWTKIKYNCQGQSNKIIHHFVRYKHDLTLTGSVSGNHLTTYLSEFTERERVKLSLRSQHHGSGNPKRLYWLILCWVSLGSETYHHMGLVWNSYNSFKQMRICDYICLTFYQQATRRPMLFVYKM